ncbi:MAG: ferrous iron transport protein A [Candidatus Omnitrophota bacterium]
MIKKLFNQNKKNKPEPKKSKRTLCDACNGEEVRIECLEGEVGDCQRLREMGFCEKAKVEKINENGALICKVCDTKVIISEELARNIIIGDCREDQDSMKKIVLLSQLAAGQQAVISDFVEENDTCARLEEMGVTPGEKIEVVRYAPLGDPIEIKVRGYLLSLRKEEAELIKVYQQGNL